MKGKIVCRIFFAELTQKEQMKGKQTMGMERLRAKIEEERMSIRL